MGNIKIPIDASRIPESDRSQQRVRVALRSGKTILSEVCPVASGSATANFDLDTDGPVTVAVGPESSDAASLFVRATPTITVRPTTVGGRSTYTVMPIVITLPIWALWLRWCRTFTISGYVYGPDGNPVPSAAVTAFDVDWFWWWSSTSQVGGTAVTDPTGFFSITFEWCCGWLPWYWWDLRDWRLDPVLVDKITPVLAIKPQLTISPPSVKPVLGFTDLMRQADSPAGSGGRIFATPLELNPTTLPALGAKLRAALPPVAEFERFCLWPWCDWWPWFDCEPNIIFKVTQNCGGLSNVILQETVFQARIDIPTNLSVALFAGADACTIPPQSNQPEGDCFLFTLACDVNAEDIAITCDATIAPPPGAPSVLAGLAYPAAVADRPFTGSVFISGQFGTSAQADYYEVTYRPLQPCPNAATAPGFLPVPPAALSSFQRTYFDATQPYPNQWFNPEFAPQTLPVSGGGMATVYESRQFYEAKSPLPPWNDVMTGRSWTANADGVAEIETTGFFSDGQYEFQIVGYTANADGSLNYIGPLAGCGDAGAGGLNDNNDFALYLVNPSSPAVTEPDASISGVVFTLNDPKTGSTSTKLPACGILTVPSGSTITGLAITFTASDGEGFLSGYDLWLQWGTNAPTYITTDGALTPTPIVGPDYASAVVQGAARPHWYGGSYTLTITDPTTLSNSFPTSCAYELQLFAAKRNIVNCTTDYDAYETWAYYSFTVLFPS